MTEDFQIAQVPLIEQLRSVPITARQIIELRDFPDGDWRMGSRNIPYGRICHEAADALEAARSPSPQSDADAQDKDALIERLPNEAIFHAGEARAANATLNEIYQLCSGGTGEKANWNGAQPVRELIERLKAKQPGAADNYEAAMHEIGEIVRVARTNPDDFHAWLELNFPKECAKYPRQNATAAQVSAETRQRVARAIQKEIWGKRSLDDMGATGLAHRRISYKAADMAIAAMQEIKP